MIYNANKPYLPLISNCIFSNENAEKVVKPPHRPVAKNNFQVAARFSFLMLNPKNKPMAKQPTRLTSNVPVGKILLLMPRLIPYRSILPIAPPRPTIKKSLSIAVTYSLKKYISNLPATARFDESVLIYFFRPYYSCWNS